MEEHIKNLKYILRHKWYVFQECKKRGIMWRGIMHDISKFGLREFPHYSRYFFKNKSDYKDLGNTGDKDFDLAWLKHINHNPHHWQYWVRIKDDGTIEMIEMTEPYYTEMICDWIGAGKVQGKISPKDNPMKEVKLWWIENRYKMQFHPNTRIKLKKLLE